MTPKVRDILDQMDDILCVGNEESAALWSILTALRGPDIFSVAHIKGYTTMPIRTASFPKTSIADGAQAVIGAAFTHLLGNEELEVNLKKIPYDTGWGHFRNHIERAVDALGIKTC